MRTSLQTVTSPYFQNETESHRMCASDMLNGSRIEWLVLARTGNHGISASAGTKHNDYGWRKSVPVWHAPRNLLPTEVVEALLVRKRLIQRPTMTTRRTGYCVVTCQLPKYGRRGRKGLCPTQTKKFNSTCTRQNILFSSIGRPCKFRSYF